jgi:hypothetical protein
LAVAAQHRALFQPPDDGVFVVGVLVGHLGGFGGCARQIALMPILNDAILLFVSPCNPLPAD